MNDSTETLARCQRNVCALYRRRVREACARGDLSSAKFWRVKAGEWAAKARSVAAAATLGAVLTLQGCASVPAHESSDVGPPAPTATVQTDDCGRSCRFWGFMDRNPWVWAAGVVLVVGAVAYLKRDSECPHGGAVVPVARPSLTCDADNTNCVVGPDVTEYECH